MLMKASVVVVVLVIAIARISAQPVSDEQPDYDSTDSSVASFDGDHLGHDEDAAANDIINRVERLHDMIRSGRTVPYHELSI